MVGRILRKGLLLSLCSVIGRINATGRRHLGGMCVCVLVRGNPAITTRDYGPG